MTVMHCPSQFPQRVRSVLSVSLTEKIWFLYCPGGTSCEYVSTHGQFAPGMSHTVDVPFWITHASPATQLPIAQGRTRQTGALGVHGARTMAPLL